MPEETPKYTIANDLDPDDEMRAYATPMDEYVTYFLRVQSGEIADMGFELDDFKQHIAGLPEKRRNKCQILKPFVNAVRDALAQKNWYAALALALTLPDICANLEQPEERRVGVRYTQWWNTYVGKRNRTNLTGKRSQTLHCERVMEERLMFVISEVCQ
jgi:hypothetical protein